VGALRSLALALALLAATPANADQVERWRPNIAEASARFGIPAEWIEQVMRAESGGKTMLNGRPITSRAGAMGLMQLMPGTWAEMRSALGLGTDPHDPRDNVLAGTFYLRLMYDRFGYPGLFAAYNAGPARYAAYLAGRRPLPGETRLYLLSTAARSTTRLDVAAAPPANAIFFALRSTPAADAPDRTAPRSLFMRVGLGAKSSVGTAP
jgi:soluble lytic murein transglycosylase-like protein